MLHTTVFRASALLAALTVALFPIVAWGQPTTVNLDRSAGPARLWLNGEAGRDYTLQASDAGMASNSWQFLITTPLTKAVGCSPSDQTAHSPSKSLGERS